MRGIANPIFILPIIVALGIYVTMRLGGFVLPGGRAITRADSPRGYWVLIGLSVAALVLVTSLAVFEALPATVVHSH
jgi:hypothetical protein